MINEKGRRYFAASNSADGFINYFPRIFGRGRCEKLYVIKGGPGTGKSCFMKQVAKRAESAGFPVTYYYCSSDADSLDGVMIGEGKIGIIDGTPPHAWEPTLVGCFDQIVDLGVFWDSDLLFSERERIKALSEGKKGSYQNAYRYLSAYGGLVRAVEKETVAAVNLNKLKSAAERTVKKCGRKAETFEETVALCRGIGMGGQVRFDTYEEMAMERYTVEDYAGTSHLFLGALYQSCVREGVRVRVSRDPVLSERIDALTMIDTDVTFSAAAGGKSVNMKRFVREDVYRGLRSDLRKKLGAAEQILSFAEGQLEQVRKYHFALEAIYASAMNFGKKEAFTETFCTKIFG